MKKMNATNEMATVSDIAEQIAEALYDPSNSQFPAPEIVTHYSMAKERKLWIDFAIGYPVSEIQKQIMLWNMEDAGVQNESRKPIWLYIMSNGGDADYCFSVIDVILTSTTPIYTVNMGLCASAAGLIFLAGERRFMFKRSKVMIHEGSASFSGDAGKIGDANESYKALLKTMREYILERTEIPAATLKKNKDRDWELDAENCMKYKVATDIINNLSDVL